MTELPEDPLEFWRNMRATLLETRDEMRSDLRLVASYAWNPVMAGALLLSGPLLLWYWARNAFFLRTANYYIRKHGG